MNFMVQEGASMVVFMVLYTSNILLIGNWENKGYAWLRKTPKMERGGGELGF